MTSPVSNGTVRLCLFEVGSHTLGLRLQSISEVVPMAELSRPPSMPAIIEGFLNLRGTSIPVLKTADVLGLPQHTLELHTPLLIVRAAQVPLALLVKRVVGIVSIAADSLESRERSDSFNGCVEGLLTIAGNAVHLLAVDRLLLEKEERIVAEFQTIETRRLCQLEQQAS